MPRGHYDRTPEIRAKNRKSNLGQTAWNRGTPMGEKTRSKLAESIRQKWKDPAWRKATSESMGRKKLSPKHRERIGNATRGRFYGEKHHAWRGGITHMSPRRHPAYKYWRKTVLARDNHACRLCGVTDVKLHADHILPVTLYPKSALHVSNGRALCVPCHTKTWSYGRVRSYLMQHMHNL